MAKIILDTSVYIPLLRKGKAPGEVLETHSSIIYLSAVVAQELFAGAGDTQTTKALDYLSYVFRKTNRFIVPSGNDWTNCGIILSKIGGKYGFESIKKGRLVNDVLIALSCKGIGATLLTANHKDFQIIHKFVSFRFIGV